MTEKTVRFIKIRKKKFLESIKSRKKSLNLKKLTQKTVWIKKMAEFKKIAGKNIGF